MTNEKRPRRRKGNGLAQPYDSTFKDWMRHEANQAIPYLIAGAVCEGTLDTEIIRPTMRADKVFRINLDGEAHIGNFEFQTGRDENLVSRWMQILLARTETIDEAEKERIAETMYNYDPLLEKLPKVRKIREEGKAEGQLAQAQKMFITVVSARFPNLTDLAERMAKQITSPDKLDLLAQQIVKVPDEQTARWLLTSLAV